MIHALILIAALATPSPTPSAPPRVPYQAPAFPTPEPAEVTAQKAQDEAKKATLGLQQTQTYYSVLIAAIFGTACAKDGGMAGYPSLAPATTPQGQLLYPPNPWPVVVHCMDGKDVTVRKVAP
jgi:hypothetical protein